MKSLVWFLKRFIEKLREEGLRAAFRSVVWGLKELRDRIEERRFDHSFQINTCHYGKEHKENPPLKEGHLWYDPSRPKIFYKILNLLPLKFQDYTFIDLGSGKGRTLLMASNFPFKKIIGVEYVQHYHEIACQNLTSYKNPEQKCFDLESVCGDAGEFTFPEGNFVLYLCNPFGLPILKRVMMNLEPIFKKKGHDIFVVYVNPLYRAMFDECPFLKIFCQEKGAMWYMRFLIYRTETV